MRSAVCSAVVALVLVCIQHLPHLLVCPQESGAKWDAALETQLCYEVKTFLLAGHETSAAMLTWSTLELAAHSQAADKVGGWRPVCVGGGQRGGREGMCRVPVVAARQA